jgi:peptidoglycan hydrolase CwlO-like protein
MEQTTNPDKFKNTLILILAGVAILFACTTFFRKDGEYAQQVKDLHAANEKLQAERALIDHQIVELQKAYNALEVKETALLDAIAQKEAEIAKSRAQATKSKAQLDHIMKEMAETRRKIKELTDNPPNRTGNDLLNSLKLKTQK